MATPTFRSTSIATRADELVAAYQHDNHRRTDRLFAGLLGVQWVAGIILAVWVSPLASGSSSGSALHGWTAVTAGAVISIIPALLGLFRPGLPSTRFTIATAQMLMGALLIHLTGGRIETHLHVFGSLALISLYRDWRVLVAATLVTTADHMLRGAFWPQSMYGVFAASQWRWIEHAAWILFEDAFLIAACSRSVAEMHQRADETAAFEQEVRIRQLAEQHARDNRVELAKATQARSDLLASMSHELRTPLNAIILYSELLQEQAQDAGNKRSISDLERIQLAGRHLLEVINGILDLSKIEAGKMALTLETFEVRRMIDQLVDTVGSLVEKNGNTLTVRCADEVGTMTADRAKTKQILLNLLSNAGKFTRGGSIQLTVERCVTNGRETLEFVVNDTGAGMTAEQASRVFDPFAQGEITTRYGHGGVGLGLVLVSRFCELMGGQVSVDSLPGVGSRFTVRLPRIVVEASPELHGAADAA